MPESKNRANHGLRPTATVVSGALAGTPLGVVVVWLLNTYLLPVPMPAEIAVAIGSLVASAVSYFTRGGRREPSVTKE